MCLEVIALSCVEGKEWYWGEARGPYTRLTNQDSKLTHGFDSPCAKLDVQHYLKRTS